MASPRWESRTAMWKVTLPSCGCFHSWNGSVELMRLGGVWDGAGERGRGHSWQTVAMLIWRKPNACRMTPPPLFPLFSSAGKLHGLFVWRAAGDDQSVNLWQAFFQRHAVHHMSRFSIPYTLRHFFPSPRTFRLEERWRPTAHEAVIY